MTDEAARHISREGLAISERYKHLTSGDIQSVNR